MTILREPSSPTAEPEVLALGALSWLLSNEDNASRLLELTGLTPDALRTGLNDRAVLAAVLDYLCRHEPDLIATARAIGVAPPVLVAASERLNA